MFLAPVTLILELSIALCYDLHNHISDIKREYRFFSLMNTEAFVIIYLITIRLSAFDIEYSIYMWVRSGEQRKLSSNSAD